VGGLIPEGGWVGGLGFTRCEISTRRRGGAGQGLSLAWPRACCGSPSPPPPSRPPSRPSPPPPSPPPPSPPSPAMGPAQHAAGARPAQRSAEAGLAQRAAGQQGQPRVGQVKRPVALRPAWVPIIDQSINQSSQEPHTSTREAAPSTTTNGSKPCVTN